MFPTADAVTEVPLLGDGVEVTATSGPNEPELPPPNRGRAAAIAVGVVATVAVVAFTTAALLGGDEEAASATTLDPGELATAITTPPTLSPLEALPPPEPVLDEGPQPTTSQDWRLFDDNPPPTYPEAPDITLRDVLQYDLLTAVARLADDVPRRSETHYELGTSGFVLDVTIERDPVRDRYRIITESRGQQQVAIVDGATATTYVNPGTDNRIEIPNAEIIENSTATTINEYFDRLLKGPVRPDSFVAQSTRGRSLVVIPGVGPAREFVTAVDGVAVPEWQIYAFGPTFEFRSGDRPTRLEYHVYVDDDDDVVQVDGISKVGNVTQLVQHRLTLLEQPAEVLLPAADETATAPSAPPATTSTTPTTPTTTSDPASG